MNTRALFSCVLLTLTFSISFSASASPAIDQQYNATDDGGFVISSGQSVGQSFRPSFNGYLTGVDLDLAANPLRSGSVQFLLCRLNDAVAPPGALDIGPALLSTDFSITALSPTLDWFSIPFRGAAVPLLADQNYVMILKTDIPEIQGGTDPLAWRYSQNGTYDRGFTITSPRRLTSDFEMAPAVDSGFKTYMTVPEPAPIALFIGGVLTLALTVRRRAV
jgi:hypothetical protein